MSTVELMGEERKALKCIQRLTFIVSIRQVAVFLIFKSIFLSSIAFSSLTVSTSPSLQDEQSVSLDEMIDSMCSDVESIRKDAEAAQSCLVTQPTPAPAPLAMLSDLQRKITELTEELVQSQSFLSKKTSG